MGCREPGGARRRRSAPRSRAAPARIGAHPSASEGAANGHPDAAQPEHAALRSNAPEVALARVGSWLTDLEARDPPVVERVEVLDSLVGEELAVERADHLMDADEYPAVASAAYLLRLDARIDHRELARPVVADRRAAFDLTALHSVRPRDLLGEPIEDGADVSAVERRIELDDLLSLGLCHCCHAAPRPHRTLRNDITQTGRPRDELRRRQLCQAAAEVLLDRGLDRTSLEDLSAATGVSARMLIHYFGSKDGLLSAALNEARRQQLSAAHEHLARAAVADVHDLLVTMRSFLASPATERHLRLFTEVAAVSARDPRRFSGFSRASVHDWLPALEAPLRQAGHDAATATALATLALAVERGLLLDSNATGERARVEAAHEALLRLLRL